MRAPLSIYIGVLSLLLSHTLAIKTFVPVSFCLSLYLSLSRVPLLLFCLIMSRKCLKAQDTTTDVPKCCWLTEEVTTEHVHSKPLVEYEGKLRTCFKDVLRQVLAMCNTTRCVSRASQVFGSVGYNNRSVEVMTDWRSDDRARSFKTSRGVWRQTPHLLQRCPQVSPCYE